MAASTPHFENASVLIRESLYFPTLPSADNGEGRTLRSNKVTIIGTGAVGLAAAYSILGQGNVGSLVLADVDRKKLHGEVLDFQHAGAFLHANVVEASEDYHETANSDLIVITAGARQRPGETRIDLIGRNVKVFESIIPVVVKHSPDTLLLVVSNPVDVLTYLAWKMSGLPVNRVIGSGTYLDTSRFRVLLGEKLGVNPRNVHAYILGEHGDSSVAVNSGITISGINVMETLAKSGFPEDQRRKAAQECHDQVKGAAYEIISLKGYTNWAIGAAVGTIVTGILGNQRTIMPVSVNAKGCYGIMEDVFFSLPAVVGRNGIENIVRMVLAPDEEAALAKCASGLVEVQKAANI